MSKVLLARARANGKHFRRGGITFGPAWESFPLPLADIGDPANGGTSGDARLAAILSEQMLDARVTTEAEAAELVADQPAPKRASREDEMEKRIAALEAQVADLRARNTALTNKGKTPPAM